MTERCALETLLDAGGPVRVAVRPCCLAALVGRGRPQSPVKTEAGVPLVCAAAEVELRVPR